MHESGFSPAELYECSKICDPNNSPLSDSSYFCQVTSPLIMERSSYRVKRTRNRYIPGLDRLDRLDPVPQEPDDN